MSRDTKCGEENLACSTPNRLLMDNKSWSSPSKGMGSSPEGKQTEICKKFPPNKNELECTQGSQDVVHAEHQVFVEKRCWLESAQDDEIVSQRAFAFFSLKLQTKSVAVRFSEFL